MEGRYRAPPADHPFPDHPDLKRWTKPKILGLLKFSAGASIIFVLWHVQHYFARRNTSGLFGDQWIPKDKMELVKRLQRIEIMSEIRSWNLNLQPIYSTGPGKEFDDGIKAIMPTKEDVKHTLYWSSTN